MSDLQEKVEQAIRETLHDPEGAGSDLSYIDDIGPGDEWLFVEGNLDIRHLASHVIETIGVEYEYAMQVTVKGITRPINSWYSKERAQEKLDFHGTGRSAEEDPLYGPWSAKIVKRRKAGPVE